MVRRQKILPYADLPEHPQARVDAGRGTGACLELRAGESDMAVFRTHVTRGLLYCLPDIRSTVA